MNSNDPPPADTWMGWSNGRWDGDTLVIDSKGFMGSTISALDGEGTIHVRFLDRAGNYHTDGLHVVERIRRTGPDHLLYQATIEDPNVYTRPWTISMPLYRRVEPNMQLGEFKCEEFVGDLVFGRNARAANDDDASMLDVSRWRRPSSSFRPWVSPPRSGRQRQRDLQSSADARRPAGPSGLLDEPDVHAVRTAEGAGEQAVLYGAGGDRRVQQGRRRLAEPGRPLREHRFRGDAGSDRRQAEPPDVPHHRSAGRPSSAVDAGRAKAGGGARRRPRRRSDRSRAPGETIAARSGASSTTAPFHRSWRRTAATITSCSRATGSC